MPETWTTSGKLSSFENNLAIRQTVDEAKKRLLALEENWDGEGSPAYQERTLEAAAGFLYALVEQSETLEAAKVRILPASEGSIDLHWKTDRFELLVNFRPDGSVPTTGTTIAKTPFKARLVPIWSLSHAGWSTLSIRI